MANMPSRVEAVGDLWKPLLQTRGRARLGIPEESRQKRR
jgi:hypothetical protein